MDMTEKQQRALDTFLAGIEDPEAAAIFRALADTAIALGYTPKRTTTKDPSLDFAKARVKRTLLKLEVHSAGIRANGPGVRLKYYATADYSRPFQEAVRRVIEAYDGKYTGCYGCGRCGDTPEGYTYAYPDGRRVFRCGGELNVIPGLTAADIPEAQALMRAQDAFFMAQRP